MLELTQANFDQHIFSGGVVVVDFTAEWCPPCRLLAPMLERIAPTFAARAIFATVDADQNPQILARYHIAALPTVVVFSGGEPVHVMRGVRDEKTLLAELGQAIDPASGTPAPARSL